MLAEYRRALEAQVGSKEVEDEMKQLRERSEALARYPTVQDLEQLINDEGKNYEDKDAVLAVILARVKQGATLFPVLNLMFLTRLAGMYQKSRRAWADDEELFGRVQTEFYRVAVAYPLDRRPRKIDVNLLLDTRSKVNAWLRREGKRRELHEGLGPEAETGLRPTDIQERAAAGAEMEAYLLGLLRAGIIDEQQYDLLLETAVYRRMTQKEWAEAHGVAPATARSWRHRAWNSIREFKAAAR
ncbi:MAG: hypothetical protein R6X33_08320 [Candidatus Brocadiia bacterium]